MYALYAHARAECYMIDHAILLFCYYAFKLHTSKLRIFECRVKLSGVLSAVQTACFGMTDAQNDTNTSMNGVLFNIVGDAASNKLICRTKNSTLTVNQASTTVLSNTTVSRK